MTILDHPSALVARREVSEGFRSKGFWIMLGISVAAIAAILVITDIVGGDGESVTELAIVGSPTDAELSRLEQIGDAVGTTIEVSTVDSDDAARAAVRDGDADAALLAGAETIVVDEPIEADGDSTLAAVINVLRADLALTEGLTEAGLSPDEIAAALANEPPAVESLNVADDETARRAGTAIIINIVLFLLLQTYGGWVVNGVTREKSSRVVEVLLSTLTARQLMYGKIVGIGVLALLHAAVLVVAALITAASVGIDVPDGFRVSDILVGGGWFILGYALYCSVFAATGSLCDRAEDAQGAILPVMLPLIAGYIIAFSAVEGASPLLWVLAYFPPTAVVCMPVLSAVGAAPGWAVALSVVTTAISAYGVARVAAAIYSRSILKRGKRVSWREALRRDREAVGAAAAAG